MNESLNWPSLAVGFAIAVAIGWAGYRRRALNRGGMLGAIVTGTLIFGLGGWAWGVLLVAFFASSSALSFYRADEKAGLAEKFAKGSRRDLGQALANGGLTALLAALAVLRPEPSWTRLLFAAGAGALAAVNADTWATELGVFSPRPPRLITTGRRVEVGTSGSVTLTGTLASLAGAAFIGLLAGAEIGLIARDWTSAGVILAAATLGGLAGALVDSLLGATVQAIYWCDTCQKETERRVHRCGTPTRLLRGYRWLDNDLVNFGASAVGAAVAAGLTAWLL